jgi:hypothetical protein
MFSNGINKKKYKGVHYSFKKGKKTHPEDWRTIILSSFVSVKTACDEMLDHYLILKRHVTDNEQKVGREILLYRNKDVLPCTDCIHKNIFSPLYVYWLFDILNRIDYNAITTK